MLTLTSAWILPAVFLLDFILGDPRWLPHPVRWMGRAIEVLETVFRPLPFSTTVNGALFAAALIGATWAGTLALLGLVGWLHPGLGVGLQIVLLYYSISARSLAQAAMDVHRLLARQDLGKARYAVGMIVGRETHQLSAQGVATATVETVAENLVDGVLAPLLFAVLGGAPAAVAYKMANTLDSMVGYKNDTYRDFGKTAARFDDLVNYIPARLAVAAISLAAQVLNAQGRRTFFTARREGRRHSSPNAGYPEAAFAGTLAVRLGGPNRYHGQMVSKPYIGECFGAVRTGDIPRACDLMWLSTLIWVVVLWGVACLMGWGSGL